MARSSRPRTVEEESSAFFASAVYLEISRVNHSCAPTMGMVSKQGFCRANKIRYAIEDGGSP